MLQGEVVTLTSLHPADAEQLFAWINDPGLVRQSSSYTPVHYNGHKAWFRAVTQQPGAVIFAVRVGERLIGSCQLFDISPVHRSAELQIRIGDSAATGRGYGTDAVKTLLRFAAQDAGLHSVWLRVYANNQRAIRCYEKAGLTRCGCLRQAAFVDGQWLDTVLMQIVFPEHRPPG